MQGENRYAVIKRKARPCNGEKRKQAVVENRNWLVQVL
jgi:hypothetical protein